MLQLPELVWDLVQEPQPARPPLLRLLLWLLPLLLWSQLPVQVLTTSGQKLIRPLGLLMLLLQ